MDKIFYPNKWFVAFCALLIVVWGALQLIINMRVTDEAKQIGELIFTWSWKGLDCQSSAQITGAEVLKRTATDAIVKIRGKQVLTCITADQGNARKPQEVDCTATLTFYRSSSNWVLGKVELE